MMVLFILSKAAWLLRGIVVESICVLSFFMFREWQLFLGMEGNPSHVSSVVTTSEDISMLICLKDCLFPLNKFYGPRHFTSRHPQHELEITIMSNASF